MKQIDPTPQLFETQGVSLVEQLACIKRELSMRRTLYPRWIASSKMTKAKAAEEIMALEAVERTLVTLIKQESRGAAR